MLFVFERNIDIPIIGTVIDPSEAMVSPFTRGGPLKAEDFPDPVRVDIEHAPDEFPDYFELQQIPIASTRLVDALQHAGVDNIVPLPATLAYEGNRMTGFVILHIVGRVAAMDQAASECTHYRGQIVRIRRLALSPSLPTDLKMFRLDEKEFVIVVNQHVRDVVVGLPGVVVSEAEGWSDSHWF